MQLLDAINTVLSLTNEATINQQEEGELKGAQAKEILRRATREVLLQGWSINTQLLDFPVDVNGKIPIASDYLAVRLPDGLSLKFDTTAGTLFVWNDNNQDWHGESLQRVEVTYAIPEAQWTSIPEALASYIAHHAAVLAWVGKNRNTPNPLLEKLEVVAKTKALNNEPRRNINRTSGFRSLLGAFHRGQGRGRGW